MNIFIEAIHLFVTRIYLQRKLYSVLASSVSSSKIIKVSFYNIILYYK